MTDIPLDLLLDALSLRETPWLMQGTKERGYTIHDAGATDAEPPPPDTNQDAPGDWVPPIDVVLDTAHGKHASVLGRRKWKSQSCPPLARGGLSLLGEAVPFTELSRPAVS